MASLPDSVAVSQVLSGLLGKQVGVQIGAPFDTEAAGTLGVYLRGDEVVALCFMDMSLSNQAGAALSMIPAGVSAEGASNGTIEDNLLENLSEVLNIGAQWFSADGERVALGGVSVAPSDFPEQVRSILTSPGARGDFEVEIPGYGGGRMTVLS